ncbi:MAG: CPBP family intramembrane metalloprotease [Coriobacteriales bacterium]|jgi:membrane protease YdiL (CAAX protease family)|nr:CPBP family intramembrane metalloprotease [Coriobacteriales bacterium]
MPDVLSIYKSTLRRQIMVVVLVLLGFYVLNTLAVSVVEVIYLFANFTTLFLEPEVFDVYDILSTLPSYFLGLASIISIITGALIFFVLRGKRLLTTDITHVNEKIKLGDLLLIIVLMLGVQAVTTFGGMIIEFLLNLFDLSMLEEYSDSVNLLLNPAGYLYIVLIGPIVEEIMFRGGLMRSLERFGVNFSIVVSSLLFGMYHVFIYQACFAFFLGVIMAYTAQRFSLKWAILLHMLNNGYSVVMSSFSEASETLVIVFGVAVLVLYVSAIVGSIIILVLNRQRIKAQVNAWRPASMLFIAGIPQSGYAAPQPVYAAPQPVYATPQPMYAAPQPVYAVPPAGTTRGYPPPASTAPSYPPPPPPPAPSVYDRRYSIAPPIPAPYQDSAMPPQQAAPASYPQPYMPPQQAAPVSYPQSVEWGANGPIPTMPSLPYPMAPQYVVLPIPINSRQSPTGIKPPLALDNEPKPHPYRLTFSSAFVIVIFCLVLFINFMMIFF